MKGTNTKKRTLIFLLVLMFISFLIRFHQLGKIPNGLTTDEADLGYNAYSLIKTTKDVYGRSLPLVFQSLDDYKPPLAIYFSIPAVNFFGLSEYSVRLVAAIFGFLSPLLFYWLVGLLYPKKQFLAVTVALLILFAPWNIAISRIEPALIEFLSFYLTFFILFFLGIKKDPRFLFLSAVPIAVTLYIYYASLIYVPITLVLLAVTYYEEIKKYLRYTLISVSILILFALPAISIYSASIARNRFNSISIFTPDITLPTAISETNLDQESGNRLWSVLHNRRYVFFLTAVNNYLDYFNLDYLFVSSNQTRYFYVNYVGLFYLVELPFVFYGLFILARRRTQSDLFILCLLLISPIPGMITLGSSFVHRALMIFVPLQIISAVGLSYTWANLRHYKTFFVLAFTTIYIASVLFFLHQYFIHSPTEFNSETNNGAWFSSVRDVIPIVESNKDGYDKIVFSWKTAKLVPAVYFLFYNRTNPQALQAKAAAWTNEAPSYKQIYNQIGNIEFRPIDWQTDQFLRKTLFIGYPNEFPSNISGVIAKTFDPTGSTHFLIVKGN